MDNEFIDVPIDEDKQQEQQQEIQSPQVVLPVVYPQIDQPKIEFTQSTDDFLHKITFHMTEQVSSSITQYYENIQYVIHSQIDETESSKVIRKYTHFDWLNAALKREFIGYVIPAVPPKSMLAKINLAEHTQIVREKRYRQLEEFLNKVKSHPKLQSSEKFMIFLRGNQDVIQKELSEMSQYQPYAQQMGSALLNVGSKALDIAKGSFTYLSSFIYSGTQSLIQQPLYPDLEIQNDIKEFFESWEDLLIEEQQKIKRIYNNFNSIISIKIEQNEETKKMISSMKDLQQQQLEKNIIKTEASCYINETILNEIKLTIIFKLELSILDLDEALNIIKNRFQLIQLIQQQIKNHNTIESFQEKLCLKDQIRENQRQLKQLESNFQSDIKPFAFRLNKYIKSLICSYNEQFYKLCVEQQKTWCE